MLISTAAVALGSLAGAGAVVALGGREPAREDAPTAAAEVEPPPVEPGDEPSPEPDVTPADIRNTDWIAQEWTTSCGSPDSPAKLHLAPVATDAEGGGDHAYLGPDDAFEAYSFAVDVAGVTYVDATGNGREEAVFVAHCVPGNFVVETLEVWHLDDADVLQQLPPAVTYDRTTGYVEEVSAAPGRVRVTTAEPAEGMDSPWIDGGYPVTVVTDHRWDDDGWVQEERSRQTPAAPACGRQADDADEAARCFLDALASGDREAAARVASAEAIRDLAGADVAEILRDWDVDPCEYTGGAELGMDGHRAEWACGWSVEVEEDGWRYAYGLMLGINAHGSSFRVDWIEWWET